MRNRILVAIVVALAVVAVFEHTERQDRVVMAQTAWNQAVAWNEAHTQALVLRLRLESNRDVLLKEGIATEEELQMMYKRLNELRYAYELQRGYVWYVLNATNIRGGNLDRVLVFAGMSTATLLQMVDYQMEHGVQHFIPGFPYKDESTSRWALARLVEIHGLRQTPANAGNVTIGDI